MSYRINKVLRVHTCYICHTEWTAAILSIYIHMYTRRDIGCLYTVWNSVWNSLWLIKKYDDKNKLTVYISKLYFSAKFLMRSD